MSLFDLTNRVVVVTGATGVLPKAAAQYLCAQGARVAFLGRNPEKLRETLHAIRSAQPDAQCLDAVADVLDREALERARDKVVSEWGVIDALLNGAGGNQPGAVLPPGKDLGDLNFDALRQVVDVNLHGTILPSLVFAPVMMAGGRGSIINYSSASVPQAITRVAGYSAAKAGVDNFTRWLAVELGTRSGGRVRVNSLTPGFFLSDQNRRLLTNEDGTLTDRGRSIIQNTPMGRFGEPSELFGAVHYLLADAAKFVTGTTAVVDGGFTAFSGV